MRCLHFCLNFLIVWKNGFKRKLRLISKFMTSQTGQQKMTKHNLSNISKSKDNQAMNIGQSIKYNVRNIFL